MSEIDWSDGTVKASNNSLQTASWSCSEQERLANIKRNQELLKDLDLVGHAKPSSSRRPSGPSRATKSKSKSKQATKNLEPQRIQPRRTSNRLAGVEADSETLKRKYEVSRLMNREKADEQLQFARWGL